MMNATHDDTGDGGADGRGDVDPARRPHRIAGRTERTELARELLEAEGGVEHERHEDEREHRRRRPEHEEARIRA